MPTDQEIDNLVISVFIAEHFTSFTRSKIKDPIIFKTDMEKDS